MSTVIINGSLIKSEKDFHIQMKLLLSLPEYYGENLDALWDCLTAWIDLPIKITWVDFDESKKYLGEYTDQIIKLFDNAKKVIEEFDIVYS